MTEITTAQASYLTDLRARFDIDTLRSNHQIHLEIGRPESSADPRVKALQADPTYSRILSIHRMRTDPRYEEALDNEAGPAVLKALQATIRTERYENLIWALTAEITTSADASKAISILK